MTTMQGSHAVSPDDRRFREDFETCRIQPAAFDHRSHIRLAYIYLAEYDADTALVKMRAALQAFIAHHGISPAKYHETLTRAWILAVRHFMATSPATVSSADFVEANPAMLDTTIMLTHYSAEVLFSPEARARFVEPDLDAIPRYGE